MCVLCKLGRLSDANGLVPFDFLTRWEGKVKWGTRQNYITMTYRASSLLRYYDRTFISFIEGMIAEITEIVKQLYRAYTKHGAVSACLVFNLFPQFRSGARIPRDLILQSVVGLDRNDTLGNYASPELLQRLEGSPEEEPVSILGKRGRDEIGNADEIEVLESRTTRDLINLVVAEKAKFNRMLTQVKTELNESFDRILQKLEPEADEDLD
jgi:hypothetical protein